jgi:mRNA-degrading endonuclease RelE of RelBE toxin-antitoxin system
MPIDILPGAENDIELLEQTDPAALAVVLAFLDEARADAKLIDKFASRGDINLRQFRANVKPWVRARATDNLFRIRILDTPATVYRVVYGYDWRKRRIGILAILHKEAFDYEIDSQIAERIFNDWYVATEGQPT